MRTRFIAFWTVLCAATVVLTMTPGAHAVNPPVYSMIDQPVDQLFEVENGSVEPVTRDGETVWRWHVPNGQNSLLSIRKDHPLYVALRYYDYFRFDYRVASGALSSMKWEAVGHVSGPRQYKVHNQRIAIVTTEKDVWHPTHLRLDDAYWFPWDNVDGEGEDGFFRLEAMSIEDDTVIEIRSARLIRALILLKPDYMQPVTWPIAKTNDDGSVTYSLQHRVINSSGQPADITAKVLSKNKRFKVAVEPEVQNVKSAKIGIFNVTATISKADIDATAELYEEPIFLEFAPAHRPEAVVLWEGQLVRPLSPNIKRQVMLTQRDVDLLREKIDADDEEIKKLAGYDESVTKANEFLTKKLQTVPRAYNHVRNGYLRDWVPGEIMSEAVNTKTGERRIGDFTAGAIWREYLGYSGMATMHTGLAYAMTGNEDYAKKAIELMKVFALQYADLDYRVTFFDVPYFPGTPIQASSRIGTNSSYGSNWDFKWFSKMASLVAESPSWTDEDRDYVYREFVIPYASEIVKLPGSISNQTDITNHNLLLLGLAFNDATMVWKATLRDSGLISRLSDIDRDGFSSEGRPLNYHGAAANEYIPSTAHFANSGIKINFGLDRVIKAVRMPYERGMLNGIVPNTGDSGRGMRLGASILADMLAGVAPEEEWLLDIGNGATIESRLARYRKGEEQKGSNWKSLLSTKPHLFADAGLAILRSGDDVDNQVMLTLDYGRSVFHGALDRNQITLGAFGKIFTHGPGSLYNAGSGGIQRSEDERLRSFIGGHMSLTHNVLVIDQVSQMPAVGRLLAWSDDPARQVAVSEVAGIAPGVTHTRGALLQHGIVVLFDKVRADKKHSFDMVYHNFGDLTFGKGFSTTPVIEPLGKTGNYEKLVDPMKIQGAPPLEATWDLTLQYPSWNPNYKTNESALPTIKLRMIQSAESGAEFYTAKTGLNNTNTNIMADAAPSIIQRVDSDHMNLVTVLEPVKGETRIVSVEQVGKDGVRVKLKDGKVIEASLTDLIKSHPWKGRPSDQ